VRVVKAIVNGESQAAVVKVESESKGQCQRQKPTSRKKAKGRATANFKARIHRCVVIEGRQPEEGRKG
jgi:hypothetical protein